MSRAIGAFFNDLIVLKACDNIGTSGKASQYKKGGWL